MGVEAKSSFPCQFESGDTLIVTLPLGSYAPADWNATLYLSLNGSAQANFAATESGGNYTFTISATASAAIPPATYDYAVYVVSGSERERAMTGQITVTPNLAASQTPSFAQSQVTLLQTVLAEFAGTTKASVSFNSQSFTRASIKQYQEQYVFWQAQVLKEQAQANARRGINPSRDYAPYFGSPGQVNPYSVTGHCGC